MNFVLKSAVEFSWTKYSYMLTVNHSRTHHCTLMYCTVNGKIIKTFLFYFLYRFNSPCQMLG
jgi:hypothetical protein